MAKRCGGNRAQRSLRGRTPTKKSPPLQKTQPRLTRIKQTHKAEAVSIRARRARQQPSAGKNWGHRCGAGFRLRWEEPVVALVRNFVRVLTGRSLGPISARPRVPVARASNPKAKGKQRVEKRIKGTHRQEENDGRTEKKQNKASRTRMCE